MPTAVAGPEIERLIQLLARLPGLGPRSARRAALHLIKKRELLMAPLGAALATAMEKIVICGVCGNIDTQNPCTVCTDGKRDPSIIIAVAEVERLGRRQGFGERNGAIGLSESVLDRGRRQQVLRVQRRGEQMQCGCKSQAALHQNNVRCFIAAVSVPSSR